MGSSSLVPSACGERRMGKEGRGKEKDKKKHTHTHTGKCEAVEDSTRGHGDHELLTRQLHLRLRLRLHLHLHLRCVSVLSTRALAVCSSILLCRLTGRVWLVDVVSAPRWLGAFCSFDFEHATLHAQWSMLVEP